MANTPNIENYDVTLDDGTTTLGLMYAREPADVQTPQGGKLFTRRPQMAITRVAPLPLRNPIGQAQYSDKPADVDFVWPQDDWSGGFGQYKHNFIESPFITRAQHPNKYAWATGWETRWPHVLTMGAALATTNAQLIGPNNQSFEAGTLGAAPTDWVGSGATIAKDNTADRVDEASFSMKVSAGGGAGSGGNLNFATTVAVLGSPTINISCRVWASNANNARIRIRDNAVGSAYSSYHTGGSTFETLTASIGTGAPIALLDCLTDVAATTAWFDNFKLYPNGITSVVKFIVFNGILFCTTNRSLHRYDATNDYWIPVMFSAVDITDAEVYSVSGTPYLFIARGASQPYVYMSTTYGFTVSNLGAGAQNAEKFRRVGTTLWKVVTVSGVVGANSSTDPRNTTGSWSTAYTLGDSDKGANGLYSYSNLPVVGKQEGLFTWDGTSAFKDSASDFASVPSSSNFSVGFPFRGNLYTAVRGGRVVRWDGTNLTELLDFVAAPQLTDFGGTVSDFASDGGTLYFAQKSPTSNTSWIMGYREALIDNPSTSGVTLERAAHTIRRSTTYNYTRLAYFSDKLFAGAFLSASDVAVHRLALPVNHQSMALDTSPNLVTSAELVSSWWDGGFPDTTKAFLHLDVSGSGLDANKTLLVEYQLDSATDGSAWNTLGTVNTNSQSLYFSSVTPATLRNGTRIRFRLTGASNSTTAGPQIYSAVLHSTLRHVRIKQYSVLCELGQGYYLASGGVEYTEASAVIDSLRNLENTVNPLTLKYKHWQDGKTYSDTVHVVGVEEVYFGDLAYGQSLLQITLVQVVAS